MRPFGQALTPLLIVVQVGLTDRYHIPSDDGSKRVLAAQDKITFRAGVSGERDSRQDIELGAVVSSRPLPSAVHGSHV